MPSLKKRLKKARRKFFTWRRKRRQAKPGGKRRKRARRLQDWWEARKHKLAKKLKRRRTEPPEAVSRPGAPTWNGCRFVTDRVDLHVAAPTTSRKRTETFGNPGSEHHVSQTSSDAIDFGIANAFHVARSIYTLLTGRTDWGGDYSFFFFTYAGMRFRGQLIAGTHGTGPHLHFGCTRIA